MIKKPSLNSYIWLKYAYGGTISFSRERVIAKGQEIFFHTATLHEDWVEEVRRPLRYEDYGITWFKSLTEIKEKFGKLKRIGEGYYERI